MGELWTRKRERGTRKSEMGDEDKNDAEDMRNLEYDLHDRVGKTLYQCYYTPDQDLYLPYRRWYIDSHTKFSNPNFS